MNIDSHTSGMNDRPKILLFGGGLHGQTCIDAIEHQGKYELVGIIDSILDIGSFVDGYEILGRMEKLPFLVKEFNIQGGFIGIGDNWSRKKVRDEIVELVPDFEFVNIIHPTAIFGKNVTLGKGVLIAANTFISSSCILGDFCFVHQKAHLGLHNKLGSFASVSGGSLLGGKVKVGEFSAITLSATVHDRLVIGAHTVVGSCSLVTQDLPDHVVVYGQPARIIRKREEGEPYLKSG